LPLTEISMGGRPFALVAGRVVLPPTETNQDFSSRLVGANWNGGMHYLAAGGQHRNLELKNPFCIRVTDFNGPFHLEIAKMGYKNVELSVPASKIKGKVVWVGNIAPQPYTSDVFSALTGEFVSPTGGLFLVAGKVTVRVNGTPGSLSESISNGRFSFTKVPPGKYLVEFWLDNYSAATWGVDVPESSTAIEKKVTVFPRYYLTLKLHTNSGPPQETRFQCGVAYRDAFISLLSGEKLQVNQAGAKFELYDAQYHVTVTDGPFQSLTNIPLTRPAWFSWGGALKVSDLIVLKEPKNGEVTAVAEVLAIETSAK
jgi:hypothetical protein